MRDLLHGSGKKILHRVKKLGTGRLEQRRVLRDNSERLL
jgi:hypothetical protein